MFLNRLLPSLESNEVQIIISDLTSLLEVIYLINYVFNKKNLN